MRFVIQSVTAQGKRLEKDEDVIELTKVIKSHAYIVIFRMYQHHAYIDIFCLFSSFQIQHLNYIK